MAFCADCGQAVAERDRFCSQCGTEVRREATAWPVSPSAVALPVPDAAPAPLDRHTLGPPQYGSMFRDSVEPPQNGARQDGGLSTIVVVLGAVGLIALSAVVGYRWFARPLAGAAPPSVVTETEQVLTPQPDGKAESGHTETTGAARSSPGDGHADARGFAGRGWTVVTEDTRDVKAASDATVTPDGRTAVIAPGGALALAWSVPFYDGSGPDVRIFGPEGDRTPYTLFARDATGAKWVRFDTNSRGFPTGMLAHDFGHHGVESAQQIMIRNDGVINLYIDAIAPLHAEPEAHGEDAAKHRDPPH